MGLRRVIESEVERPTVDPDVRLTCWFVKEVTGVAGLLSVHVVSKETRSRLRIVERRCTDELRRVGP